jgi:hypothetical protein
MRLFHFKGKRGQITLFLAIGIIILISFSFILFFKSSLYKDKIADSEKSVSEMGLNKDYFLSYTENCLTKTSQEALEYVSNHGGYYNLPHLSAFSLPYYFYNISDVSPSISVVEKELGLYVDDMLFFCLEKFENFEKQGFSVLPKEPTTTVEILNGKVIFNLNYPLVISKGSKTLELSEFQNKINSNMNRFLDFKHEFMVEQINETDSICLSCLKNISKKYFVEVDVLRITNNSFTFTLTDSEELVPKKFNFINYYDFKGSETIET